MADDTGAPKKGRHSVGVAWQCCGQLGKQDNCQVTVTLSFAADHASLPIACICPSHRLYLPQPWADAPARRARAGVPDGAAFQTKPQIALARFHSWFGRSAVTGRSTSSGAGRASGSRRVAAARPGGGWRPPGPAALLARSPRNPGAAALRRRRKPPGQVRHIPAGLGQINHLTPKSRQIRRTSAAHRCGLQRKPERLHRTRSTFCCWRTGSSALA